MRSWFLSWVLLALCAAGCRGGSEQLSDYGAMPEFELRDQRDQPVRAAELRGRVLVVDFIFTTCPDVCPLLTQQLVGLRKQLAADGRINYVSFSVDPEHDTPAKLKAFAAAHGADQPDWYFLTGPLDSVREVVTRGFKQAMQIEPEQPGKPRNVLHGSHFVLVDRAGTIRGFFRSDAEGMTALRAASQRLLEERSSS
ncbi:MAG TPA: SCO family protein [Polyangiales bacterium]|nr:SCO family protein [Polyangiales bacterium]